MYHKIVTVCLLIMVIQSAAAQNTFKIQPGAIIKITGGEQITLQDMNLDNDGTFNMVPGDGTIRFSGSQNNTITGTSVPNFDVLEMAKTGGGKLSLLRNININSAINFTSGLLDLNNKNILLQPTALLNSESESSRITGANGGYVEITKTLNAPSAVNPGNLGAIITTSQNLGSTIIRRGHKSQVNANGNGNSIFRYYDIIPSNNSALNATLRLQYFDAELNGLGESIIVLWKSIDNITWTNQGFTTRNTVTNFVEKINITDFSRWTLSSPANVLPISFLLFNANCTGNHVVINWKTTFELNTVRFVVERSAAGNVWTPIGILPASGVPGSVQNYTYVDVDPLPAGGLYRIAGYNINGQAQYTSIIHMDCGISDGWQVSPNPVQEQLFLHINTASASPVTVKVFDEGGALVSEQHNALLPGINELTVNMKILAAGLYHIVAEWGNGKNKRSVKVLRQ